jgi:hypothetical protein
VGGSDQRSFFRSPVELGKPLIARAVLIDVKGNGDLRSGQLYCADVDEVTPELEALTATFDSEDTMTGSVSWCRKRNDSRQDLRLATE